MKLGIFGGTFNPPHVGHLIVSEHVCDHYHFDKIIFIPSANPPHKNDPSMASAHDRFEMTQLAVKGNSLFEASRLEIERSGLSYTVDSLAALISLYPRARFSLIIGYDNFIEFETWKSPHEIIANANLIVMNRPGFSSSDARSEFSKSAEFVTVPQIGISGSDIRRRVKMGRSIRYLVPKAVEEYIVHKGLYR